MRLSPGQMRQWLGLFIVRQSGSVFPLGRLTPTEGHMVGLLLARGVGHKAITGDLRQSIENVQADPNGTAGLRSSEEGNSPPTPIEGASHVVLWAN